MTEHTPGTWYFNGRRITTGAFIVADIWNADDPTGQANAALIAAAPELLAALKELSSPEAVGTIDRQRDARIVALIAKAERRES